jgi:hypothetical protein
VKQSIKADVRTLDLILHQGALYTLMNFTSQILESFSTAMTESDSVTTVEEQRINAVKKEDKKQGQF